MINSYRGQNYTPSQGYSVGQVKPLIKYVSPDKRPHIQKNNPVPPKKEIKKKCIYNTLMYGDKFYDFTIYAFQPK